MGTVAAIGVIISMRLKEILIAPCGYSMKHQMGKTIGQPVQDVGRIKRTFAFTCLICGKGFKGSRSKTNSNKYCSRSCYHSSQIGVARVLYRISREYKYLFRPNHPDSGKQGYIAEHRLVAELMLGRRLKKNEVVHHKNGNRGDNRPTNLEVLKRNEHSRKHSTGRKHSPQTILMLKKFSLLRKRDKITKRFIINEDEDEPRYRPRPKKRPLRDDRYDGLSMGQGEWG